MRQEEQTRERDLRPAFDCEIDTETGSFDEVCVRDYLRTRMPLAV
jgi:hypothetical protein